MKIKKTSQEIRQEQLEVCNKKRQEKEAELEKLRELTARKRSHYELNVELLGNGEQDLNKTLLAVHSPNAPKFIVKPKMTAEDAYRLFCKEINANEDVSAAFRQTALDRKNVEVRMFYLPVYAIGYGTKHHVHKIEAIHDSRVKGYSVGKDSLGNIKVTPDTETYTSGYKDVSYDKYKSNKVNITVYGKKFYSLKARTKDELDTQLRPNADIAYVDVSDVNLRGGNLSGISCSEVNLFPLWQIRVHYEGNEYISVFSDENGEADLAFLRSEKAAEREFQSEIGSAKTAKSNERLTTVSSIIVSLVCVAALLYIIVNLVIGFMAIESGPPIAGGKVISGILGIIVSILVLVSFVFGTGFYWDVIKELCSANSNSVVLNIIFYVVLIFSIYSIQYIIRKMKKRK